jgi:hypothetical protein
MMILYTSSLCCNLSDGIVGLLPDCRQGIYTMTNTNCKRWFSIK